MTNKTKYTAPLEQVPLTCFKETCRPPDKSAYWKSIFLISHPKHMLSVLKRTVSMRRFF